jgi:chromosome segregation ATPase
MSDVIRDPDQELDRPDDISLDEVHEEIKRLKVNHDRKTHQSSYNILNEIRSSLDLLHGRFDQFENRMIKVESRIDQVENRFNQVEDRFDRVDDKFDEVKSSFSKVDKRLKQFDNSFNDLKDGLDDVDDNLVKIEDQVRTRWWRMDQMISNQTLLHTSRSKFSLQ